MFNYKQRGIYSEFLIKNSKGQIIKLPNEKILLKGPNKDIILSSRGRDAENQNPNKNF